MSQRVYDVSNVGAANRIAVQTVLVITAGSGKPVRVLASAIECENATSFQVAAQWQKITTLGAGSDRGTTTTAKTDEADTAAGFTAIGDISVEPTTYDTALIREAHAQPSILGYHSHVEADAEPVKIKAGESWGLVVKTASYAGTTWRARALVAEESL